MCNALALLKSCVAAACVCAMCECEDEDENSTSRGSTQRASVALDEDEAAHFILLCVRAPLLHADCNTIIV